MNIIFYLFLSFSLVIGCQIDQDWDSEAQQLIDLQSSLYNEQTRLIATVDSIWDATSYTLSKEMPIDIPPVDRRIFIESRNADHMLMFMSFKKLDPELQELVHLTAAYDKMLATKIRAVAQKQKDLEKRKMSFLQQVAQHNMQTYNHYAAKLRSKNESTDI